MVHSAKLGKFLYFSRMWGSIQAIVRKSAANTWSEERRADQKQVSMVERLRRAVRRRWFRFQRGR
jgi:hypothetical protein